MRPFGSSCIALSPRNIFHPTFCHFDPLFTTTQLYGRKKGAVKRGNRKIIGEIRKGRVRVLFTMNRKRESADKPGSVVDSHSSGMSVTRHLKRPTRTRCGPHLNGSLFGLAPSGVFPATTVARCAVRSYRTISPLPDNKLPGGIFSVALSVDSRLPGVTWHSALWSPDFPLYFRKNTATV